MGFVVIFKWAFEKKARWFFFGLGPFTSTMAKSHSHHLRNHDFVFRPSFP